MGFGEFMKKMITGRPIFEDPQNELSTKPRSHQQTAESEPARRDRHGNKILPEVVVGRIKYYRNGPHVEVWGNIYNTSLFDIMLDKIRMLGMTRELDHVLKSGTQHEFKLYSGPIMQSDSYRTAELYYRDEGTGDYFCADHYIEYKLESDQAYIPEEMKLIRPIKDV